MDDIPRALLEGLSPVAVEEARRWWGDLTNAARQEIIPQWDERQDFCFFPPERADAGEWRWIRTPKVIGGRFMPPEVEADWEQWRAEYFDYLISNPELVHLEPPVMRVFYIG